MVTILLSQSSEHFDTTARQTNGTYMNTKKLQDYVLLQQATPTHNCH